MKKILVTGSNSYIGRSFEKWINENTGELSINFISLREGTWKSKDFSEYDVVLHLAGIAHASSSERLKDLYYRVNRDLTIDVAKKAKAEGVKQFIFMSSIIVYGNSITGLDIDRDTVPKPLDFYGDSKLQAEYGILPLEDNDFKIVVLRPPMVYGKGSNGNYLRLSKLARIIPFFPQFENKRSILHIDNLCEIIRLIIANEERGFFYPQNSVSVRTCDIVLSIAKTHKREILLTRLFNPLIRVLIRKISIFNKVFGDLVYDPGMSHYKENYQLRDFYESIYLTEK
ncbi:NAD-dependent epimerase/dehydratase family protein [Paenibacillus antri]|uniref:NAD-dependent epimerase/dehydratase family protein n=1 Tax=Paenibacillus antri TaxID=2582848 RepID=A0A5R9GCE3_9BACL|nr:NAD-dependent epimerase/dehydratase family protein [Paenibacillus antri]TLS51996.1 NAD-dependent epimerase/dehydratase family protein [Paenibacillus antri]